jgi:hypothetical protein
MVRIGGVVGGCGVCEAEEELGGCAPASRGGERPPGGGEELGESVVERGRAGVG